ncbi:MAG: hypothetical protein AB1540_14265 [Bdellovibrionota bacterium]
MMQRIQGSYWGLFFGFLPLLPFVAKLILTPSSIEFRAANSSTQVLVDSQSKTASERAATLRLQLLMGLDLLVRAEHALHHHSYTFTKSLGRVPDVLGSITSYYRTEIVRATRDSFVVVATGEGPRSSIVDTSSVLGDRLAIDEKFNVRSNFQLPEPSRDYLHTLAQTVMNQIARNQFQIPEKATLNQWEGVFKNYFRYEVRSTSKGDRAVSAVGVRAPVKDDVVEVEPHANLFQWVYKHRNSVDVQQEAFGRLENLFFAARISHDHLGGHCTSLEEVVPYWNSLLTLKSEHSPLALEEFRLDTDFGYHAEIAYQGEDDEEEAVRSWTVNGYGQVSEISPVERIVSQFENARRRVASHGENEIVKKEKHSESKHRPLLIDAVENDR